MVDELRENNTSKRGRSQSRDEVSLSFQITVAFMRNSLGAHSQAYSGPSNFMEYLLIIRRKYSESRAHLEWRSHLDGARRFDRILIPYVMNQSCPILLH